jgi:recombination endonuclease VII
MRLSRNRSVYHRHRYEKMRLERKCLSCGEIIERGVAYCPKCVDRRKIAISVRNLFNKNSGLCLSCSSPSVIGRIYCSRCSVNRRLRNKPELPLQEKDKARKAMESFQGRCECCGSKEPEGRGDFHIDHKNDKFRGILCSRCNTSLGLLNDSEQRILQLQSYLLRTTPEESGLL